MKEPKKQKKDSLGATLKNKRGARGIRAVAKEIGISPSTLSRIENGKISTLANYRKVEAWLGQKKEKAREIRIYSTLDMEGSIITHRADLQYLLRYARKGGLKVKVRRFSRE